MVRKLIGKLRTARGHAQLTGSLCTRSNFKWYAPLAESRGQREREREEEKRREGKDVSNPFRNSQFTLLVSCVAFTKAHNAHNALIYVYNDLSQRTILVCRSSSEIR